MSLSRRLAAWLSVALLCSSLRAETILLEGEAFDSLGGWVVDQQFMGEMGSPFLLAHGLGTPVAAASTSVRVPRAGTYRLFVRTRNWVAPWTVEHAPGRFRVHIDGVPVGGEFGTSGSAWHWQPGGSVRLEAGTTTVSLQDLTGFEGRCDAVLLTDEADLVPPAGGDALAAFRRRVSGLPESPADGGEYDLAVTGGGVAGLCAALAASRLGLRTVLIQDRPVLGGNNSSEVRVWLGGERNLPPYPRLGDIVREMDSRQPECPSPAELYPDGVKEALARAEALLALRLNEHVTRVDVRDGRIEAVVSRHVRTGRETRYRARLFADCTGDGTVGYLAGAEFEMTLNGHMGPSNLWRVTDRGRPAPFPSCPWAIDLRGKAFPSELPRLGRWYWENGFFRDPIADGERIRDQNFRAMYGAWDCLKNDRGLYPTHELEWAAYVAGKRESRRLLGDVVLNREDVVTGRKFPDACVPCTWKIDLHLPDPRYVEGAPDEPFISRAHYTDFTRPYGLPYRTLYSRNVPNLFMAGRHISVTHEALGTARVMRTTGMMGEVVGMAAAVCIRRNTDPRGVYEEHFPDLRALLIRGVGKPVPPAVDGPFALKPVPDSWGKNLAPGLTLSTSGDRDSVAYPAANCTDGTADLRDNAGRWLSSAAMPAYIELRGDRPFRVGALRLVSGYRQGDAVTAPVRAFHLESLDGDSWRRVAGSAVEGNDLPDCRVEFAPVAASAVRIVITAADGDIARVHEVELYGPASGRDP